jgi:hypothetical protein
MRILRRHSASAGTHAGPAQQAMSSATAGTDRWQATPFDGIPSAPDHDAVMRQVEHLTDSLAGSLDEGTYTVLDPLIDSWVDGWITRVEADYTEHCAAIAKHRGQVSERLVRADHVARHEHSELDRIRAAYLGSRSRLGGDQPGPGSAAPGLAPEDGEAPAAEGLALAHDPAARRGWAAPHLLAGQGRVVRVAAAVLILAGALTDTVAFRNTIELVLKFISGTLAWLLAAGATSMALAAAASLGIALAIRRRSGHRSMLAVYSTLSVWLTLGVAMFLIRWLDADTVTSSLNPQSTSTPLIALFFGAIYLISGACTIFEAERLYNPEYFAFKRLREQHRRQVGKAAEADAALDRARSAVDHADGEFDRENHRRDAAITAYGALGDQAKRYARVRMTAILKDPAKTHVPGDKTVSPPPPTPGPQAQGAPGGWASGA